MWLHNLKIKHCSCFKNCGYINKCNGAILEKSTETLLAKQPKRCHWWSIKLLVKQSGPLCISYLLGVQGGEVSARCTWLWHSHGTCDNPPSWNVSCPPVPVKHKALIWIWSTYEYGVHPWEKQQQINVIPLMPWTDWDDLFARRSWSISSSPS